MTTQTAWGVMFCEGRKPYLFAKMHRTRKNARAEFITWWRDAKVAEKQLKSKRYRIVKVRLEVAI